ncbi:MAG: tetratricopeptide repeat protein [Bacteroidota bacterium]
MNKKQVGRRANHPKENVKSETLKPVGTKGIRYLLLLAIVAITFLAYIPSLKNNFTNWDEKEYVLDNQILKQPIGDCIKYFFTNFYNGNYHPLTMIVYAFEYHHAQLNPVFYHQINLMIHLMNVILIFFFVFQLSSKKAEVALIVSLLFGIHPMHVESVAWIAELKDVLYGFFFILGLIAYLRFIDNKRQVKYLSFTFLLFVLALLSKPAAVVFPMVLLLLDYYRNREWYWKSLIEKTPFFICSIVFGILNVKAQETSISPIETHSLLHGFLFASYGIICYIYKMILPINLSALYPIPNVLENGIPLIYYVYLPIATLLIFGIYKSMKQTKVIIFGSLFFLINLLLVLQIIPVGGAIIADRYSYISFIGLLYLIAYGFNFINNNQDQRIAKFKPLALMALIIFFISSFSVTYERCKIWENSETLWSDVIEKYPENFQGYLGRGEYLMNTDKYNIPSSKENIDKAFADFNEAIILKKDNPHVYLNRGLIYAMKGKFDSALADYSKVLARGFKDYNIYMALGTTYSGMHHYDSAYKYFDLVEKMNGTSVQLMQNKAYTYLMDKKYKQSIEEYKSLINQVKDNASYYYFQGLAYHHLDDFNNALSDYTKAIDLNPNYVEAYYNRSVAFEAVNDFKSALNDAIKAQSLGFNIDNKYLDEIRQRL